MTPQTKKRLKIAGGVLLALILLGAIIDPFSLTKVDNRVPNYTPTRDLKVQIAEDTKQMSEDEIIDYSVRLTAKKLSFATNDDIPHGEANCMGYAQMLAGISNYAFKVNGIHAKAKPVVGYVKMLGINLHPIMKFFMPSQRWKNFVKDHDFVEFTLKDRTIYADACAYDLIFKDAKTTI